MAAGILNTLLGLAVILGLDLGLGVPSAFANAIGYGIGISVGWLLQRRFVFRSDQSNWRAKTRYLTVVALAFALNQAMLWTFQRFLGSALEMRVLAQIFAVGTYSVSQFLLLKAWVFAPPSRS